VQIRTGRGDDSRGERGRVEFEIGVTDQRLIERSFFARGRDAARQQREQVTGKTQFRIRGDQFEAASQSVSRGDQHGNLSEQPDRFAETGGVIRFVGLLVKVC
jgi:hypothetical protein